MRVFVLCLLASFDCILVCWLCVCRFVVLCVWVFLIMVAGIVCFCVAVLILYVLLFLCVFGLMAASVLCFCVVSGVFVCICLDLSVLCVLVCWLRAFCFSRFVFYVVYRIWFVVCVC